MRIFKPKEEFKVGKHDIGWMSSDFLEYLDKVDAKVEKRATPTCQKLPRDMADAEIESELKPGLCELGDILAFLENPPEGSKDGYWNLFYTRSCVVDVYWSAGSREWGVDAWQRDDGRWDAGRQVFSPATGSKTLEPSDTQTLSPSDPSLEKAIEVVREAGYKIFKEI